MDIPQFLYRGDADPHRERQLRSVWPGSSYGGLLTNLSNKGSGIEIFSRPLIECVNKHVAIGWVKSHFLSFSESYDRAMMFAVGDQLEGLTSAKPSEYWDAGLITLDTSTLVSRNPLEEGVYGCKYLTKNISVNHESLSIVEKLARSLDKSAKANLMVEVVLIDVVRFLRSKNDSAYSVAIKNAERDREWLVLPVDPSLGVPSEWTARLDDGCISDFECYRRKPEH